MQVEMMEWTLSPVELGRKWSKTVRTLDHYRTRIIEKTVKSLLQVKLPGNEKVKRKGSSRYS